MRKLLGITIALVSILASSAAFARPHHARHQVAARHAHTRVQVTQTAPIFPDIFKMPLFGDVANYGPVRSIKARVARTERTEQRRTYMAVNPREREDRPSSISFTSEAPSNTAEARPRDCYGIQWCGCFMRHLTGLNDPKLNLAANWRHVGSPTSPHSGAIVVFPSGHHVGQLRSELDAKGNAWVYSGNNGSGNRATVRYQHVGRGATFRQL